MNGDVQTIVNNYDNLGILEIVKYLLQVVINDIEYMNDLEEHTYYDLGNNNIIFNGDYESIVSTIDTIDDIVEGNK